MIHSTRNVKALSYAVSACVSLALGFYLGAHFGAKNVPPVVPLETKPEPKPESEDGDDEDEEWADGDLSSIKPRMMEPCKLVLVVRTDLQMTQGKIAAHHATLACYKALMKTNPKSACLTSLAINSSRQAKIALRGSSEEELLELEAIAKSLNLCARSILDAGRTQIAAGSRTVLGIGPAPVELVNQVTRHLKLL
ncbi:peptidyl-tRNA hydrolase II [Boletus reticuloceps]|uniref:peptidyl-tRNA hydrolase n=1 Tax=Boletus reticuloceps TaxID=495285 RepID=A0A8I3A5A7_9AGAM|nr:peptidyl-tRNA hydrolase II [Boletus reticuloceps]